ncbi:MAG: glycosyltransferase [Burkholderiaceae bacterium]
MSVSIESIRAGQAAEAGGDAGAALGHYAQALAADPRSAKAWTRVGMIMVQLMKWREAAEQLQLARQLDPQDAEAAHGLAVACFHIGETARALEQIDAAAQLAPQDWRIAGSQAYMHAATAADPARTLALYRAWGERFADPLAAGVRPPDNEPSPTRRLRIGYVTADFREHSVAFFMEPVLAHHDAAQVEVFVYSSGRADEVTARLRALVPHWHDVAALDDEALHGLIRSHRIDVLIDLSGHTVGQRLFVFARRAAPVQVTWLGFMHTLGMRAIDYRITDGGVDPPGNERWYVERLFRVGCMACYSPPPDSPLLLEPPLRQNGFATLISLNNAKKLTDPMLQLWGRILQARPTVQLVVMVQERNPEDARAQIEPRLRRLGLPLDRVLVSPQLPLREFMQLGHIADVALDTAPISGGTTSLHALWMGLPVVALDAEEAAQAATARTLQGLGLGEWVAHDADSYLATVLALIDDAERLRAHRSEIRERMRASAPMDYRRQVAELERALRLMWLNHLLGEPRYLHTDVDLEQALRDCSARLPAASPLPRPVRTE